MFRNLRIGSYKRLSLLWQKNQQCLVSIGQRLCFSGPDETGHKFRPPTSQSATMLDIGTRSIFNEDNDILRESVRKFFKEEVLPNDEKWQTEGQVSHEIWLRAGEQGFLAVDTPSEYGGVGGTFFDAAIIMEEQSYINNSGCGFPLHSHIVIPYIVHSGTKEQIEHLVPDMVAGKKIGAIAMTEPSAGSDLQGIRTVARKDGNDWILNGSKVFITNGYMADVVLVVAITDTNAKSAAHGISIFIVEEGMPGFKKGRKLKKMGFKSQDTAELFFEDVRLPQSSLLGELNHGFYYLMRELPQERLVVAVMSTANMEWMFEETRAYVKQRKAFGKNLANLQTVQHKLAEMKTEICVTRSFIDQCIELHSENKLDSDMASMAKYWASELQNRVAYTCVQMHGGWGYMAEFPICKAYIDARLQPIYAGSNEIMKELIARKIVFDKRI